MRTQVVLHLCIQRIDVYITPPHPTHPKHPSQCAPQRVLDATPWVLALEDAAATWAQHEHVLIVGSHCGMLAGALAGAHQVTIAEQGPVQSTLTSQVVQQGGDVWKHVGMLDGPLHVLGDGCDTNYDVLVVAGLLDNRYVMVLSSTYAHIHHTYTPYTHTHRLLHSGLLAAVHTAAPRMTPNARLWPATVKLHVQLLDLHVRRAAGLDLSPVNTYRWWPCGGEGVVDLARYGCA